VSLARSGLRADSEKLRALLVIGLNERGKKRCLQFEDGIGESTQGWRELLLNLKGRGFWMAPTRQDAQPAFDHFIKSYEPKYPNAVHCVTKDRQALLAFMIFRLSTGRTYVQRTRLIRPLPPSVTARTGPRSSSRVKLGWR